MALPTGRQARVLIQRCAQSPHAPASPNLPTGQAGIGRCAVWVHWKNFILPTFDLWRDCGV